MKRSLFFQPLLISLVLFMLPPLSIAGNPLGAYYHRSSDRLFWFMILSDSHIGTDGSQDTDNLTWAVNEARDVIDPLFIVNTGDLTDSTNGGLIPNGPYQEEWERYRQILDAAGMDTTFYFDIPGNHDAYNDENFAYYLAHSIQGSAFGTTQHAWVRNFPFGRYHFLGVCTAGNDGAPFSIWPWDHFGDHAGLDEGELTFIESQLMNHPDAALTLIFGHHPFEAGYSTWIDTGLTYGLETLLDLIDNYGVSQYGFGHTHDYRENFYYDALYPGVFYLNVASLGKSGQDHYAIMAVDGNGLSVVPADKGTWPVVLITAPVDQSMGNPSNPFAYEIPQSPGNPIRALVFDKNTVVGVAFRIDEGGDWHEMEQVNDTSVWQGFWDASASIPGPHVIDVRAYGSTVVTDRIETSINPDICIGDFNRDEDVDGSDLAVFAMEFGRTDCSMGEPCEGDFDRDNDVDGSDLAVFATDFGRTDCP